jgi:hypothetical protein
VGARDHLDADHLANLRRGSCPGIGRSFDGRDVSAEESGNVSAADFFPSDKRYVSSFESRIARFEQGAKSLAFNHSNCLLSHLLVDG